nr:PEPxxWA-CTERM sorting domain-containing protein [Polymorphobacter sp.]
MTALVAGALVMAGSAQAASITSFAQGWVNSAGNGNGASSGNNTFTGNEFSDRYNSWAAFALPAGTISSATLTLKPSPYQVFTPHIIEIHAVTTSFADLASSSSGIAGYTDLGDGALFASVSLLSTQVTFSLSAAAISAINASAGGNFIIGFTNVTLNGVPSGPTDDFGIYPGGNLADGTVLNFGTVPEPASWAMLIGGFGLTGAAMRRRRNRAIAA